MLAENLIREGGKESEYGGRGWKNERFWGKRGGAEDKLDMIGMRGRGVRGAKIIRKKHGGKKSEYWA